MSKEQEISITDLLRSDGSIIVNKKLAKKIGLNSAIVLSELIARYEWHKKEDKLDDEWFYCTQDKLEEQTSLNRYHQDEAIKNLEELGLIKKEVKGIPAKRYFRIEERSVWDIVTNKDESESQSSEEDSNKVEKGEKQEAEDNSNSEKEGINTNNNVKKNNTNKTYVQPRNCSVATDIFLNIFRRQNGIKHSALSKQTFLKVEAKLDNFYDKHGEEDFREMLSKYFDDFKRRDNDGLPKLQHFLKVSDRFTKYY